MTTTDAFPGGPTVADGSHNGTVGSEFRLRELWRRYGAGDSTARDNLVLSYAPLVKVVAGRVGSRLPAHIEETDLIAYGLTGLMGAIERYDPERGVQFRTFALARIRGAMIDALRTLDWVPRRVRLNARELERAEARLAAKLGRAPDEAELAAGIGVQVETLRKRLLEIDDSRIYSFDAPLPGRREQSGTGDASLLDVVSSGGWDDPQGALAADEEAGDLRAILADAIGGLSEREQFVLSCRYREDLRLGEIGEVMGVSESRVSQLHAKALISLRAVLGAAGRKRLQLAHTCS